MPKKEISFRSIPLFEIQQRINRAQHSLAREPSWGKVMFSVWSACLSVCSQWRRGVPCDHLQGPLIRDGTSLYRDHPPPRPTSRHETSLHRTPAPLLTMVDKRALRILLQFFPVRREYNRKEIEHVENNLSFNQNKNSFIITHAKTPTFHTVLV